MPKQVDAHRILMRGQLTLQALGRFNEPLGKKRSVVCSLIDHFLFCHFGKKAEKSADAVVLLEYHTVGLINTARGTPVSLREPEQSSSGNGSANGAAGQSVAIELRRQNLLYSPSNTLAYWLSCTNIECCYFELESYFFSSIRNPVCFLYSFIQFG